MGLTDNTSIGILPPLKFTFEVTQSDFGTPNAARIMVWNLKDETAQKIQNEYATLVVQAGYQNGNYGIIFTGQIRQVRRGRFNPTDTYLAILAQDGDEAHNYAVVNKTLAPGAASPNDQFNAILQAMGEKGIGKGYVGPLSTGGVLPRGKVLYGMAANKLTDLARTNFTTWSIQNGKLQMVPQASYVPGTAIKLNARSGMIGLPTQTDNGIDVKALLNPQFKIGALVQLNNKSIQRQEFNLAYTAAAWNNLLATIINDDGYYRIYVAEHHGDTRGNYWYTDLTCLSASGAGSGGGSVNWLGG